MEKIAFGPYLGDFRCEVFYFLPYIRWVKDVLSPKEIYISSHFNRKFLYHGLATEFFPINPMISADEISQKNHFNKNIYKTHYNVLEKDFKSNFDEDNIQFYNFEYNKYKMPCSMFQLKFDRLNFDIRYRMEDKILFIPDRNEKESYLGGVLSYLTTILGNKLVVAGDSKTHLNDKNVLLNSINYHDIVYKELVNYISSCKAVICPASVWSGIANLQERPILSWGNRISEYKDGKYYFNNKKGKFYPKLELNNLIKCIDKFLEEL